jgi:hypothetical protein
MDFALTIRNFSISSPPSRVTTDMNLCWRPAVASRLDRPWRALVAANVDLERRDMMLWEGMFGNNNPIAIIVRRMR